MVFAPDIDDRSAEPTAGTDDQRVVLHGVSWDTYDKLCEQFAERSSVRMTYLAGALEIMVPSHKHEWPKKTIARLVEAYADHFEIDLNGLGNTTFRNEAVECGLEPDECYMLGDSEKEMPDIAIEVIATHTLDKLEVYRGLGVPEVWSFRKGRFVVHVLEGTGSNARYVAHARSELLPDLDLDLVATFAVWKNQRKAVAAFREALRAAPDPSVR